MTQGLLEGASFDPGAMLALYDAIENRDGDVFMWRAYGLTDEDEVPKAPMRVLKPSFKMKEIDDACEEAGFPRGWFKEGDHVPVPVKE